MRLLLLAATCAVLFACAHSAPGEMTAEEHRIAAAKHEAKAQEDRAEYDQSQTRPLPVPPRSPFGPESPDPSIITYNPTAGRLADADKEMQQAAQHLASANKLEKFEDKACAMIPPAQRASCPLLASQVQSVSLTPAGVSMLVKPGHDANDINNRLNCHLAYSYANGFDKPSCPLFVKGMKIEKSSDNVIELKGENASAVSAIQRQARRVFTGELLSTRAP